MRHFYNFLSFAFCMVFFPSSALLSQEKPNPPINDLKLFNGYWVIENNNPVNGYYHPKGKEPSIPLDGFSTETFTSNNVVAIPSVVSTISDSVFVFGMNTWLYDLNLQTFITHSYCSDLDITLRSPSGKVVTVTTDNGLSNSNIFNGTIWDDQVNPGGQVPYSSNSGLVTDHEFTSQNTASPLVPEESFSLFMGENPNGWWLLTIHDDQNDDGGSLNSWSIEITTLPEEPAMTTARFDYNSELVIPATISVDSIMINVSGLDDYLMDVDLTTWLRHSYAGDLDVTLKSPSGTIVTLTTDNGSGNDDVFNGTFWDDHANVEGQVPYVNNEGLVTDKAYFNNITATPIAPEESFAAFMGENPNGTWVLTVSDDAGGDGGTLDSVSLYLTTTADILLVELSSFTFKLVDDGVNLSWVTFSEINNKGFEVERSSLNNSWEVLSFINGKGTSSETNLYFYTDTKVVSGNYLYRLKQINFDGSFEYSDIIEVSFQKEINYNLSQNFPNPFNPTTKITFSIPEEGFVKLTIHNIIGEIVSTIVNEKLEKGIYSFDFDASSLPSGIYLSRIEVNNFKSIKKMILIK